MLCFSVSLYGDSAFYSLLLCYVMLLPWNCYVVESHNQSFTSSESKAPASHVCVVIPDLKPSSVETYGGGCQGGVA